MEVEEMRGFCDSGIVEDCGADQLLCMSELNTRLTQLMEGSTPSVLHHRWGSDLLHTKIPVAVWRLAELEFFSTRIPIAKWRLREFYMEKKNKMYRGSATSFGFKKPTLNNKNPSPDIPPPQETLTSEPAESLTALKNGTPRLPRTKKDSNLQQPTVRPNRFGFRGSTPLSNKVSDSQNDSTKASLRLEDSKQPQPVRSHLPRLQFPVRLAAPAGYHSRTASVDKSAKTAANNHTARRSRSENGGSSASSVNGSDSGVGSQKSGGEMEIEQLECSPSARNKNRNKLPHKSRPMEMIFPKGNQKKFELRDLPGGVEMTEIISLELPPLPLGKRLPQDKELVRERARAYMGLRNGGSNSGSSEDEGVGDDQEEKLHRDRVLSEKDERGTVGAGEEEADMGGGEDLWGHEEAMAPEEELSPAEDLDSDPDRAAMTAPLRSVLLSIEDHSFAALAAMSTSAMLEDESCPDIPDYPNSLSLTIPSPEASPNDPDKLSSDKDKKNDSPGSPGTPTHTSNSLSLSSDLRDKDDFFDDEICDQPGLVYDNLSAGNTLVIDNEDNCISPAINKTLSMVANLTVDCNSARHSSIGTLSPCESITSDDLIMDFDLSARDDDHRLDMCSLDLALTDGEGEGDGEEGAVGEGEGEHRSRQNSTLLSARPELMNGVRATRQIRSRVGSSGGSGADSPRSLDTPRLRSGSALSSPLRSSRQGTSSPGEDLSDDSGIRVQRGTYQSMYQDVINIKALLLRLSRVVQEQSESENSHVESTQKLQNGFHPVGGDSQIERKAEQEMIADLQRQIVFLHSQVEEKERKIRTLQSQTPHPPEPCGHVETCNAATQTERLRPLSTGPILSTQSDSTGASFVSNMNESTRAQPQSTSRAMSRLPQWRRPSSPLPTEQHKMSLLSMPTFRKQT